MKLLALSIGNTSINVPPALQGLSNASLGTLIKNSLNILITIAILLSLFFILFGGIKWILSQGDKKQVEEAQKTITYAVIGLIVVLLSFFIITFASFLFGVDLQKTSF